VDVCGRYIYYRSLGGTILYVFFSIINLDKGSGDQPSDISWAALFSKKAIYVGPLQDKNED
jgi:hypothetical protein